MDMNDLLQGFTFILISIAESGIYVCMWSSGHHVCRINKAQLLKFENKLNFNCNKKIGWVIQSLIYE